MSNPAQWYLENTLLLRGVGYLTIMLFFLIWAAWALDKGLYHRAAIKFLTGLMLGSFVLAATVRTPEVSAYIVTPIILCLAVVVVWFFIKLVRS
jgi:uncharacterized membrane protein